MPSRFCLQCTALALFLGLCVSRSQRTDAGEVGIALNAALAAPLAAQLLLAAEVAADTGLAVVDRAAALAVAAVPVAVLAPARLVLWVRRRLLQDQPSCRAAPLCGVHAPTFRCCPYLAVLPAWPACICPRLRLFSCGEGQCRLDTVHEHPQASAALGQEGRATSYVRWHG